MDSDIPNSTNFWTNSAFDAHADPEPMLDPNIWTDAAFDAHTNSTLDSSTWTDLAFDVPDPALGVDIFPDFLPNPADSLDIDILSDLLPNLASDPFRLGLLPDPCAIPASDSLIWGDIAASLDAHNSPFPRTNSHRRHSRYASTISTPRSTHSGIAASTPSQKGSFSPRTKTTIALAKTLYVAELVANGPSWPTKREKDEKACGAYAQAQVQLGLHAAAYDGQILAKVQKAYSTMLFNFKTTCIRVCREDYGLFSRVIDTNGEEVDPSADVVASRVAYLTGPDLRFLCKSTDSIGHQRGFDHPAIYKVLEWLLFQSTGCIGLYHARKFMGKFTLNSLAFVGSGLYCVFQQFTTGVQIHDKLRSGDTLPRYSDYLDLLLGMAASGYHEPLLRIMVTNTFIAARGRASADLFSPLEDTNLAPAGSLSRHLQISQSAIDFHIDVNGVSSPDTVRALPLNTTPSQGSWTGLASLE